MKRLLLAILGILIFIIVLNQIIGQIQEVIIKNEEEAIGTIKKKVGLLTRLYDIYIAINNFQGLIYYKDSTSF